jgi:Na+/pantothenate symporter
MIAGRERLTGRSSGLLAQPLSRINVGDATLDMEGTVNRMLDLPKNNWLLLLGSFFGLVVIFVGSCGLLSIMTGGRIGDFGLDEKFFAIIGAVYLIFTGYRAVRQAWDIKRSQGTH